MSELIVWVCKCGILNNINSKDCAVCKESKSERIKVY